MSNLQQIKTDIDKGRLSAVYFLHGDEAYFIEELEKAFATKVIAEEDQAFNQHILYAKDYDLDTVLKLAQQFPMMGDRQLILVKEATAYRKFDLLQKYLEQAAKHTVLVFSYKGKKLDARVEKKLGGAKFFYSKSLYDNQVPDWIGGEVQNMGLQIEPKAQVLMSEYLGNELGKVANELGKLKLQIPVGGTISVDLIEKHIGVSKDFNVFELVSAVAKKDVGKAMLIAQHFGKNSKNHPLVVTTASLYNFFSKVLLAHFAPSNSPDVLSKVLKVNRFFIKDYQTASVKYSRKEVAEAIHTLKTYDLKSKGLGNSSVNEEELLRELLLKILK